MKGYVRVSHLVYLIIIAVIILSFFLVIAFGGLENASTMLGTASTVSSLILSVIAILMSLVDVAGQRQQIVDLKETSEQLALSNDKSNEMIKNLMIKIEEITLLKDTLSGQINANEEWKEDIKELIVNPEGKKPEDYQKALEEIIRKGERITKYEYKRDISNFYSELDFNVSGFLRSLYAPRDSENLSILKTKIEMEFGLTTAAINEVLKRLHSNGFLFIHSNSNVEFL